MTRLLLCRMSNSGQMHRGGSMRVPAFPAEIRPSSGTRETTLSVCRTQDSAAFGPPPSARLPCRRPNAETYFLSSFCTVGTIIGVLSLLGAMATNQNGTLYARRKSTCQAHSKEGSTAKIPAFTKTCIAWAHDSHVGCEPEAGSPPPNPRLEGRNTGLHLGAKVGGRPRTVSRSPSTLA